MDSKTHTEITSTSVIHKLREKLAGVTRDEHLLAFHQDNTRPHTSAYTWQWLAANGIPIMKHPPHSPDLAPRDS